MLQHAKKYKLKLFLVAIDFDGAFDRVSRAILIRKLCLFGAGTVFTACLASIYMSTDNIIFRDTTYVMYKLYSGIKQGLPLSPYIFIFYIDDVFDFLGALYDGGKDLLHLLVHADDATVIAGDRVSVINKLRSLLCYCNQNCIIPQYTKCEFMVTNGSDADHEPISFGAENLKSVEHILLLGSHLTACASIQIDLQLHMKKRYNNVIKFYNFMRSNKPAPVQVKLKVLKAGVMSGLLYNCETFGPVIPDGLESVYRKMLKCCLNVRHNVPNHTLFVETGFLFICTLILARQWKFYQRFAGSLAPQSRREKMLQFLLHHKTPFIQHYENLSMKYNSVEEILREGRNELQQFIRQKVTKDQYKYKTYVEINPELSISPFLYIAHPLANELIKLRLGSQYFPIETGRWNRTARPNRLCLECNELGDEKHYIYNCSAISRDNLTLDNDISKIWEQPSVYELARRLKEKKYL